MNINRKTKDTLNTQLDLQEMDIREELHPIQDGDKFELPPSPYTLPINKNRQKFYNVLKNVKVPCESSSNIFLCVNLKDLKILGLKCHDCHIILQHLLLLAMHGMQIIMYT